VIYAQARGGRVRELKFAWQEQGYRCSDISIMAPHLFDGYTITSMAYVAAPHPIVFATRSDGTLLGLTYIAEHEVAAWHHHDTAAGGVFECVCATAESAEDALYAIVRRTINGRTVRYIERKHTRRFTALEDAFFVDCGATYEGSAATTISGLDHLEGATVSILADGAVLTQQAVANGAITLSTAASTVQIGLPITADLETLPLSLEMEAAGQGAQKNVNEVFLRVNNSAGIFAGPSFTRLIEIKTRTNEPYGSPPRMISDVIRAKILPGWNPSAGVAIRQSNPLPITVLSLVLDTALGG